MPDNRVKFQQSKHPRLSHDTAFPSNAMKSLFPADSTTCDIHKFLLSLPPGELSFKAYFKIAFEIRTVNNVNES